MICFRSWLICLSLNVTPFCWHLLQVVTDLSQFERDTILLTFAERYWFASVRTWHNSVDTEQVVGHSGTPTQFCDHSHRYLQTFPQNECHGSPFEYLEYGLYSEEIRIANTLIWNINQQLNIEQHLCSKKYWSSPEDKRQPKQLKSCSDLKNSASETWPFFDYIWAKDVIKKWSRFGRFEDPCFWVFSIVFRISICYWIWCFKTALLESTLFLWNNAFRGGNWTFSINRAHS